MNAPAAPALPLVLASASPRRRDLLAQAGYAFEVAVPGVEEIEDAARSILAVTRANARLKAEAVARERPGRVVVAADTLVLRDDAALGKPSSPAEALAMVRSLSGRSHQVVTAVCVACGRTGREVEFTEVTEVTFKALDEEALRRYHALIDPMDKAGAYAAQDHGDLIIERVAGSWTNVVGLPMERLGEVLAREFGVRPGPQAAPQPAG